MARICNECHQPTFSTDPLCEKCSEQKRSELHIKTLIEQAILRHLPDSLIEELRQMKDDEQVAKIVYSFDRSGNKIHICIRCNDRLSEQDLQSWYCKKCSDALALQSMSKVDGYVPIDSKVN